MYNSLDHMTNFVNAESSALILEFKNNITRYLDDYVSEIQSLFNNLKVFAEEKMSSTSQLTPLITQYNSILYNMNEIANSDINLQEGNIESILDTIKSRTIDIKDEFFGNTYLTYYHLYLHYPDEILSKIINLDDQIGSVSDKIKQQINSIVRLRITKTIEENHAFIKKTHDFFREIITIKLNNKKIFEEFKTNRNNILQPILQIEYNYVNNYNQDYLTAGFYSQKINDILDDYQDTK